jgi:hypothetical protein
LELRGDVQIGIGLTTGWPEDVLIELLVGAAAEFGGWVTFGMDASGLVKIERGVVLDFTRLLDLTLVEVKVDAGSVDVDIDGFPASVDADVGEEPSSDVAEPSSPIEVVAAGSLVVTADSSLPAVVVSEDPASPLSEPVDPSPPRSPEPESSPPDADPDWSPELGSEVGLALPVDVDNFLEEMPFFTVPVTEDDNLVPLFELVKTLVPDLEAGLAEEALPPDLLPTPDDDLDLMVDSCVELLIDAPVLVDTVAEAFAVSLLHATPIQGRLDATERDDMLFAGDLDQGFNVSLLHG